MNRFLKYRRIDDCLHELSGPLYGGRVWDHFVRLSGFMIDNKFALVPNTGMYSEGTLILPQHQLYRWQRQNGECEFVLLADSPLVIIGLSLGTLLLHSCMRHTPKSSSAESRQKIFCICLSSFMITLLAIYLLGTCGNT